MKLDRGWYFVEYTPPITGSPFASVQLVIPQTADMGRVAAAMEEELGYWLKRYPVPIMISSFDGTGSVIRLGPLRSFDHLTGWHIQSSGELVRHWRIVADSEFPRMAWDSQSLKSIYTDIPFRAAERLNESARAHRQRVKLGWWLVFIWAVAVPAGVALDEFNAPRWLAVVVLLYGFTRSYIQGLKLLGRWPKTDSDLAAEDEERRMKHHHYHCERNPEGFERLKMENFEREQRERILKEAASIRESAK
jgi:hypothetical protein